MAYSKEADCPQFPGCMFPRSGVVDAKSEVGCWEILRLDRKEDVNERGTLIQENRNERLQDLRFKR